MSVPAQVAEIKCAVLNRQLKAGSYFKNPEGRHVKLDTCQLSELFGAKSLFNMATGKVLAAATGVDGCWTVEDLVHVRVTKKFLDVFKKNLR
jgi:hypothetical protein